MVDDLFPLFEVLDGDAAAVGGHSLRDRRHRVQRQLADPSADLADPYLHELLPRLGRLVLGVLGEIAVGSRLLELLRQVVAELVLQVGELLLQALNDR